MKENILNQLEERKQELETTLKNLIKLIESRNLVLAYFEKNSLRRVVHHMFSRLNANARGSMISGLYLIKKTHELDLKLFRRCQFYLKKRKFTLEEELSAVTEKIKNSQAD